MDDYQYTPISSNSELLKEEPPISLPPNREVSGYTKASTSLAELDIFENTIEDPEVEVPYMEYSEIPKKTVFVSKEESRNYPVHDSVRLQELSEKKNNERKDEYIKKKSKKTFLVNLATVYMEILDELMFVNSLDELKEIFSKDDRFVALGILLITLAIFLVFFTKV